MGVEPIRSAWKEDALFVPDVGWTIRRDMFVVPYDLGMSPCRKSNPATSHRASPDPHQQGDYTSGRMHLRDDPY